MEYNGKDIEVIGYLYSSDATNLSDTGTAYKGETSYVKIFKWTVGF
jgi:ketosteroid isomerase-like protein